jgi:hypothetical protein
MSTRAVRPHPCGESQGLQGGDVNKGVADLRREGADQEVPEGILAEATGPPGESFD